MPKYFYHKGKGAKNPPLEKFKSSALIEGVLQLRGNYGFVLSEKSGEADVYVSGPSLAQAMDGDRVAVQIIPGRRREGAIVKVVKRARSTVVGIYKMVGACPMVIFDNPSAAPMEILDLGGLKPQQGQAVILKITKYPQKHQHAAGTLQQILGFPDDPGVDIAMILSKREIAEDFPETVLNQCKNLPNKLEKKSYAHRRNFFDDLVFTIDGSSAKDFDDAVSLQKQSNGNWRLCVHVADASEYVTLASALDIEAASRATSVYPVGDVIAMLPKKLSENLCSLKPHEERLTLSCVMELSVNGEIQNYEIVEGVIRSSHRLTYVQAQEMIDAKKSDELSQTLVQMNTLAQNLRAQRMRRGALDFTFPESEILLDDQKNPIDIISVPVLQSHQLIEEFMLLANEVVAQHLSAQHWQCLYRIHEPPDVQKLQKIMGTLKVFGISVPKEFAQGSRGAMTRVLSEIKKHSLKNILQRLVLRTLKQAVYSTKNKGHFGLASDCYTHFTSPIRRYPDLCVHRIIKAHLCGQLSKKVELWQKTLSQVAAHCSAQERLAQEAEWESIDLKKVQYMKGKLGEEFDGIISSITSFGFFVDLIQVQVEGLVHVESLDDDYYIFDEDRLILRGRRKGKRYAPGQAVQIRLVAANQQKRQLEFQLI